MAAALWLVHRGPTVCFWQQHWGQILLLWFPRLWKRKRKTFQFYNRLITSVSLHANHCVSGICGVFWPFFIHFLLREGCVPVAAPSLSCAHSSLVVCKASRSTKWFENLVPPWQRVCLLANRKWRSLCSILLRRGGGRVRAAMWRRVTTPVVALVVAFFMGTLTCAAAFSFFLPSNKAVEVVAPTPALPCKQQFTFTFITARSQRWVGGAAGARRR